MFKQSWPAYDATLAREAGAEIVLQVNGKVRGRMVVPFGTEAEQLKTLALAHEKVSSLVAGKIVVKIIAVVDKLVNVVVKG